MDNLLILLGEARAVLRVEGDTYQPSRATIESYLKFYELRAEGREIHPPRARSTAVWRKAALRYGTVQRLRRSAGAFERALVAGERHAAERLAGEVRDALEVLYLNPIARPGRRAAAINPVLEAPARPVSWRPRARVEPVEVS